jgi:hypothetical protein
MGTLKYLWKLENYSIYFLFPSFQVLKKKLMNEKLGTQKYLFTSSQFLKFKIDRVLIFFVFHGVLDFH